ncbi:MAG TPA: hypothetical protein VFS12_18680, partial [Terriglobia bacterium]|nr:hypothetical protein [Terriglobia bacterium]
NEGSDAAYAGGGRLAAYAFLRTKNPAFAAGVDPGSGAWRRRAACRLRSDVFYPKGGRPGRLESHR